MSGMRTQCERERSIRTFDRRPVVIGLAMMLLLLIELLGNSGRAEGVATRRSSGTTAGRAVQVGYASWYGAAHQSRRTASGRNFDMRALTAAHRTLPLGTRLLVVNLRNGRSTEVCVNDRGPYVRGRIVDLSYAAARQVGAISDGVVPVRIHVVWSPRLGPVSTPWAA
jgi:rare lipoprotein A